jgi:hypothetical protein
MPAARKSEGRLAGARLIVRRLELVYPRLHAAVLRRGDCSGGDHSAARPKRAVHLPLGIRVPQGGNIVRLTDVKIVAWSMYRAAPLTNILPKRNVE